MKILPSNPRNKKLQCYDGWKIFFDKTVKNNLRTYGNIRKITIGQSDDCTTRCLVDYPYFEKYNKLIAIDLSKQQKLDADPKAIQQINFTGNLENNATIFSLLKKRKKQFWIFQKKQLKYNDFICF